MYSNQIVPLDFFGKCENQYLRTSKQDLRVLFEFPIQDTPTSEEHSRDREDLLPNGVGTDVAEADAREAGHGEEEGGDVLGGEVGPAERVVLQVGHVVLVGQVVQPAVLGLGQRLPLHVGDGVEDAGEPVADERERRDQQQQHGHAVFRELLQLRRDPDQAEQTHCFQQARHFDRLPTENANQKA